MLAARRRSRFETSRFTRMSAHKVIELREVGRPAPEDKVSLFVDECYRRLAAQSGFATRPDQKNLSLSMAKALIERTPFAAEAPTGTGKTLAYLIGALAAAESLRTTKDIPIVVATATVGLQNQVLTGDVPKLVAAGILPEGVATLAKGRGRYFCVASAERTLSGDAPTAQVDFFEDQAASSSAFEFSKGVEELLAAWRSTTWTGDRDSYLKPLPAAAWKAAAADSATCLGHKCEHYSSCPFFAARRTLSSSRIVVANHDLVLADLAMGFEDADPLVPGSYLLVFDEAHHLPDKAVEAAAGSVDVPATLERLPMLAGLVRSLQKHPELVRTLNKAKVSFADLEPFPLSNSLEAVRDELQMLELEDDVTEYRFEKGELPPGLARALKAATLSWGVYLAALQDSIRALKQSPMAENQATLKPLLHEVLFMAAGALALVSDVVSSLTLLTGQDRAVRWVEKTQDGFLVKTSPLEGDEVLQRLVWSNERVRVAMVSATLQDFEGFDRFRARSGAPENLKTATLPHIFQYKENTLYLVMMKSSPRFDEREDFVAELSASLPGFISRNEGTLVLFPSWGMMNTVCGPLKKAFPGAVLCQGDMGVRELVRVHRERIDQGQGSILCGLATLAEGLDLPGAYCTHVVICALPFTVPTSPVEREQQELLGKDYFLKRALPDTLIKMVQMTGRLMRRESDRGRITVFDNRLAGTRWGRKLMDALPGFKRTSVRPDRPPLRSV